MSRPRKVRPSRRRLTPAPLVELAEPGTLGRLELRADTEEHGTVEHADHYTYVGLVRGFHAFAPAGEAPVLFLDRTEVVSFRALSVIDGGKVAR